jgi:hypothetical protein
LGAKAAQSSAAAYLAARSRKVEAREPQGPVSSWEPRMEQVRGLAAKRRGEGGERRGGEGRGEGGRGGESRGRR